MSYAETARALVAAIFDWEGVPLLEVDTRANRLVEEALATAHENGRREGLERAAGIAQAKADKLRQQSSAPQISQARTTEAVAEAIRQELGAEAGAEGTGERKEKSQG